MPHYFRELLPWVCNSEFPRSVDAALFKYTLVGYYGRERSATALDARTWRDLVLEPGGPMRLRSYCGNPQVGPANGLRWCNSCCRHDKEEFGLPLWHVIHQVPYLHHCPIHWEPLLVTCETCNSPLDSGNSWRLPGDSCRRCGGSHFRGKVVATSPGYLGLHSLALQMWRGTLVPNLRETATSACRLLGSSRNADRAIATAVKQRWNVHTGRELLSLLDYRPPLAIDLSGSKSALGGYDITQLSLLLICDALASLDVHRFDKTPRPTFRA